MRLPRFLALFALIATALCAQPATSSAPRPVDAPPTPEQDTTLPPPPEKDTTLPPPLAPSGPIDFSPIRAGLPTLWIAGDSTAAKGNPTAVGWGVPIAGLFDLTKINVLNAARGGRSSRTFITEGRWAQIAERFQPGDTVLIQFGHNDAGAINDNSRARGTLRSLGEETQEIDNLLTKQHEIVHTYGWYLRKMIADTRAKGATPILLSITVRNEWKDGKVERRNGPWSELTAELAKQEKVAFIDLTTRIADDYEKRGEEAVKAFFPKDHTHTGPDGALVNAQHVVAGLRDLPGDPLAAYVLPAAK